MTKKTIFIVEDDLLSAEYLKQVLLEKNYDVVGIVDTAEEAIQQCKTLQPDVILMDIMLKGQLSGSEAAIEIRQMQADVKIIFLTAFAETEMIDYAARSKACAYLMKPYREKEILATIQVSLMQESHQEVSIENNLITLKNNFIFDSNLRRLYKGNQEIPLSAKKLKLVELLAKNKNHFISNEQICLYVWNELKSNSTLRSLIHRFRSLINDDIITNVNGVGYSISTQTQKTA